MRKHTFTIFANDLTIYGYLFDVTMAEAQKIVENMNKAEPYTYFYVCGYEE